MTVFALKSCSAGRWERGEEGKTINPSARRISIIRGINNLIAVSAWEPGRRIWIIHPWRRVRRVQDRRKRVKMQISKCRNGGGSDLDQGNAAVRQSFLLQLLRIPSKLAPPGSSASSYTPGAAQFVFLQTKGQRPLMTSDPGLSWRRNKVRTFQQQWRRY